MQPSAINYQSNLVVFTEVKNMLRSLCSNNASGVLMMASDEGEGAALSISEGVINEVGFRTLRGRQALTRISEIKQARYFYDDGRQGLPEVADSGGEPLPDMADIFGVLGISEMLAEQKRPPITENPLNVMVVDDSKMVRKVVHKVLSKEEMNIIEIEDGEAALEALKHGMPDVVLLDIVLPGINGNQVLTEIRSMPGGNALPVIILTSSDSLVDKDSTANDYLGKPFKPRDLLLSLQKAVNTDDNQVLHDVACAN